jgi:hypothetical protein
MYSAREREHKRILAQGCEKLSNGFMVLEQVDKMSKIIL